jgi:hypothetical protein
MISSQPNVLIGEVPCRESKSPTNCHKSRTRSTTHPVDRKESLQENRRRGAFEEVDVGNVKEITRVEVVDRVEGIEVDDVEVEVEDRGKGVEVEGVEVVKVKIEVKVKRSSNNRTCVDAID